MNGYGYEYALDTDELFESDESDELFESDESDELAERRRRGARGRRIQPGRTGTGKGLFQPRPGAGESKYVTQAQLAAGLARVGKQIGQNSEAIKKVAAQATKLNSELASTTSRLDRQVGELKKEVKKQGETSLLLALLQQQPQLEAKPGQEVAAGPVLNAIQLKKQSNLLPLVLLMGSGTGGLGGGDNSSMLFLALALSGQI